jgi:hypothetical protein
MLSALSAHEHVVFPGLPGVQMEPNLPTIKRFYHKAQQALCSEL